MRCGHVGLDIPVSVAISHCDGDCVTIPCRDPQPVANRHSYWQRAFGIAHDDGSNLSLFQQSISRAMELGLHWLYPNREIRFGQR
jgi:hypothetical protein